MESTMTNDERFMARALELAGRGRYTVSPNPMVGCVIVRDDRIIAEAHHERAGDPHAEVLAIRAAGESVAGATAYVSLEPCSHEGRTPPCADALIEAGIRRVVVATHDPNPDVHGTGLARMRSAGIEVVEGVMAEAATRLNERFFWSVSRRRPFVLLKAGMSLDGKLATIEGSSRWITSSESRGRSLALREEYDAIMVGAGTVAVDNPQLTRRLGWNRSIIPWTRVVVDSKGDVPRDAALFSDEAKTILYTRVPDQYEGVRAEVVACEGNEEKLDLGAVLTDLDRRGIRSLIVEGGGRLITGFVRQELWQKMILFIAPMLIGGSSAPAIFMDDSIRELTHAVRFRFDEIERLSDDLVVTAYPLDQRD